MTYEKDEITSYVPANTGDIWGDLHLCACINKVIMNLGDHNYVQLKKYINACICVSMFSISKLS